MQRGPYNSYHIILCPLAVALAEVFIFQEQIINFQVAKTARRCIR